MHSSTVIILLILSAGLSYSLWTIFNSKQAKSSRKKSRKRKSDRVRLSATDKRIYRNAYEQYKKQNFKACAQLLESINYHREAINILEKHNQIHEAANMLMRMQLPNRAGYIYARNGYWKEAVDCFKLANLPEEVAKAAVRAGDKATAISYFIESENYHEAAEASSDLGRHKKAAELYAKINDHNRAIEEYTKLMASSPDLEDLEFSSAEIKIVSNYLISGKANEEIADILISQDKLLDSLIAIIRNGDIDYATKSIREVLKNLGPEIISLDSLSQGDLKKFANLLMNAASYEYAGILYERLEIFDKAADAFKFDQDYERAAHCYERANMKDKMTEMKILFAQNGPKDKSSSYSSELEKIQIEDDSSEETSDDDLQIILQNDKPALPVTPSTNQEVGNRGMEIELNVATPPSPETSKAINDGFKIDTPTEVGEPHKEMPSSETSIIDIAQIPDPTEAFKGAHNVKSKNIHSDLFNSYNWDSFYKADFLMDLTKDQIELLRDISRPHTYSANELILDYGEEPFGIYFVLSGSVKIFKNNDETESDILRPTESFGELWLLMEQPTNVRFVSSEESQLLTIKRADFNELLDKNGAIARLLYKRFTSKLLKKLVTDDNHEENTIAS